MKRYGLFILFIVSAVWVWPAEEQLEKVKGKDAEEIVRIVADTLKECRSFTLEVRKTAVSEEFFDEVVTDGVIVWQKPMNVRWTETNPETKNVESVAVLNPEKYYNYVPELNLVEVLDIKGKDEVEKGFKQYMEILDGGYEKLSEKYSFLVFRVKQDGEKPSASPKDEKAEKAVPEEKAEAESAPETETKSEEAADKPEHENKKEKKAKTEKEIRQQWADACTAFKNRFGAGPEMYRIKFKPKNEEAKKKLIHINFYVSEKNILSKISVAKAGGDVTHTEILNIKDINKEPDKKLFTFKIPKGAEVQKLLED